MIIRWGRYGKKQNSKDMEIAIMERLKYKVEILNLVSWNIQLPDDLTNPDSAPAYRYVFPCENYKNHKPVYIHKPGW